MEFKRTIAALAVLCMFLAPIAISEDSDGVPVLLDAKSKGYDHENNWFFLEFEEGIVGTFDCKVVDSDLNVFVDLKVNMSGLPFVFLVPDEGRVVVNGNYLVTMNNENYVVSETVNVGLSVEKIELDSYSRSINIGDSFRLTATVKPADAVDSTLTWSSSNPDVATVNQDGYVVAKAGGDAVIRVESQNGVYAECKVAVGGESAMEAKSIAVSGDYKTEYSYGDHLDKSGIIVTATYADGSTKDVTSNCIFSPEILLKSGEVKVSYGSVFTSFNVTVVGGIEPVPEDNEGNGKLIMPIVLCISIMVIGVIGLVYIKRKNQ